MTFKEKWKWWIWFSKRNKKGGDDSQRQIEKCGDDSKSAGIWKKVFIVLTTWQINTW